MVQSLNKLAFSVCNEVFAVSIAHGLSFFTGLPSSFASSVLNLNSSMISSMVLALAKTSSMRFSCSSLHELVHSWGCVNLPSSSCCKSLLWVLEPQEPCGFEDSPDIGFFHVNASHVSSHRYSGTSERLLMHVSSFLTHPNTWIMYNCSSLGKLTIHCRLSNSEISS